MIHPTQKQMISPAQIPSQSDRFSTPLILQQVSKQKHTPKLSPKELGTALVALHSTEASSQSWHRTRTNKKHNRMTMEQTPRGLRVSGSSAWMLALLEESGSGWCWCWLNNSECEQNTFICHKHTLLQIHSKVFLLESLEIWKIIVEQLSNVLLVTTRTTTRTDPHTTEAVSPLLIQNRRKVLHVIVPLQAEDAQKDVQRHPCSVSFDVFWTVIMALLLQISCSWRWTAGASQELTISWRKPWFAQQVGMLGYLITWCWIGFTWLVAIGYS